MKIAFIGNFAVKKGSRIFADVVEKCGSNHSWFIFGNIGDKGSLNAVSKYDVKIIPYEAGELGKLISKFQIDMGLVLSIWPETFSKTFFESIDLELPVIVTNIGFPPTIYEGYPWFISPNPEKAANEACKILETISCDDLEKVKNNIREFKNNNLEVFREKASLKWKICDDIF